jgi:hypothetical protein
MAISQRAVQFWFNDNMVLGLDKLYYLETLVEVYIFWYGMYQEKNKFIEYYTFTFQSFYFQNKMSFHHNLS